ncbi:hypothetical protein, partial [Leptospira interrogans]
PGTYTDLTKALKNPLDVRVLDLSEQKLTILPKEIRQLKNLQQLNLYENILITLPKGNRTTEKTTMVIFRRKSYLI